MIEIFPPPPITVDVVVVNLSNGLWDRLQDGFTYEAIPHGPTVEQVVPDAGPPGIEAIVMVDGFGEEVAVYFGPMEAEVLDRPSLEEIVVCVPERHYCGTWCEDNERIDPDCRSESDGTEGYDDESAWPCWEHTVPVTVVDLAAGISATNPWAFTYTPVPCPMIEEIVPCEGPAGILATVMIRGFSEAVSVYFGGRTAPVVDRPSLEEIVVEVPRFSPIRPFPCHSDLCCSGSCASCIEYDHTDGPRKSDRSEYRRNRYQTACIHVRF